MDEKELLRLKEQIDKAEKEAAALDGQRQYLLGQLKDQFGLTSIEAAEKKLVKMDEDLAEKKKKLDEALDEIQEKYDG